MQNTAKENYRGLRYWARKRGELIVQCSAEPTHGYTIVTITIMMIMTAKPMFYKPIVTKLTADNGADTGSPVVLPANTT